MNYAVKDVANCFIYDRGNNKPFLYTEYLNGFNLSLTSTEVNALAKGVAKIAFDGSREGTLQLESEVVEFKYFAMLLGSELVDGEVEASKKQVLTVGADNKVVLKNAKPIDGSISIFTVGRDKKTHIEEVLFDVPVTKAGDVELTLREVTEGQEVVVYYLEKKVNAKKITVKDSTVGKSYWINGITSMRNEFGEDELFMIKICNAKPQAGIELNLTADAVATFSANFTLMADENNNIIELALLGKEEAQAMYGVGAMEVGKNLKVK